jgi:hypothetical protein
MNRRMSGSLKDNVGGMSGNRVISVRLSDRLMSGVTCEPFGKISSCRHIILEAKSVPLCCVINDVDDEQDQGQVLVATTGKFIFEYRISLILFVRVCTSIDVRALTRQDDNGNNGYG